jgi:phytoene dehydrogenase-like protein
VPLGSTSYDAIVIGAGHNGLVTAAYLAKAGMSTLLLEARAEVGGTAGSEEFAGATVNICNCDHLTFRTTPIADELDLGEHGLAYLELDPVQYNTSWTESGIWALHHDLGATLDSLSRRFPDEVDNYRRYVRAARPMVELILRAAAEPPTRRGLTLQAMRQRFAGVPNLLRWSRRSASSVLGDFFSHDAISGTAALEGPMVWGLSPRLPGTGLGALTHALRHSARVGRPIGGSGQVPRSLLGAFLAVGGHLETLSRVDRIRCDGQRVRGITLADGTEVDAPVVVSACDPHRTLLEWLTDPPAAAVPLQQRWRSTPSAQGYESKIDAILDGLPSHPTMGDGDDPLVHGPTIAIAPSLDMIDEGFRLMESGRILELPGMLANVPSAIDPSLSPVPGRHVFSLEALFTPYHFVEGWPNRAEAARWLERFAARWSSDLPERIIEWRVVTPLDYEQDFHLPTGHATSFAGGPLSVFRNRNPELTRYETAVPGLYLTGAATFPGAGVWGASGRNCAQVILAATGNVP